MYTANRLGEISPNILSNDGTLCSPNNFWASFTPQRWAHAFAQPFGITIVPTNGTRLLPNMGILTNKHVFHKICLIKTSNKLEQIAHPSGHVRLASAILLYVTPNHWSTDAQRCASAANTCYVCPAAGQISPKTIKYCQLGI